METSKRLLGSGAQAGRVQFLIFAALLIALILITPVSAIYYKFQNGSADFNGWIGRDPWGVLSLCYPAQFEAAYPESWGIHDPSAPTYKRPPITTQINYVAYTIKSSADTRFYDVSDADILHDGLAGSYLRREEAAWNGTYWNWYSGGVFQMASATTTQAYRVGFYDGGVDHVVITGAAPYNIIDTIGLGWYARKDMLDPTLVGLYSDTNTLVSPDTMRSFWSISPYLTSGWKTSTWIVRTRNLLTGAIVNVTTIPDIERNWATGNVSYNLTTMLFSSAAPYGIYVQDLFKGTSLEDTTMFMYTSSGATITWDKDEYGIGDTATITTDVSPGYWDSSTYTYTGKIIDLYGVTHDTWSITSQTMDHTVDLTSYPVGDYYAVIVATAGGTDYYMAFDIASITDKVNILGHTVNAYTGGVVPLTHVSFIQGGVFHNSVSAADGSYNETGLLWGNEIGINATKTDFNFTAFAFTPPAAGTYTLNLSLLPDYIPNSTAIAGIVYDDWSHTAVPGATVWLSNATWTGASTTATGMGFYMFDGLAAGESYLINATATGYAQSADYSRSPIAGLHIVQNIEMTPMYTLTVYCRDSATNSLLMQEVYLESSDGQTKNTSTGVTTFTLGFGAYTITGSTTGYTGESQAVLMTGDRTMTLYFTKAVAQPTKQIYIAPHEVRFVVHDIYGAAIPDVTVTAIGWASSMPYPALWLAELFGINTATTPTNSTMTGTTERTGRSCSSCSRPTNTTSLLPRWGTASRSSTSGRKRTST